MSNGFALQTRPSTFGIQCSIFIIYFLMFFFNIEQRMSNNEYRSQKLILIYLTIFNAFVGESKYGVR